MKRYLVTAFLLGILAVLAAPITVLADADRPHRVGDMGFHGGISEGRFLPRTLETVLREQAANNRRRRADPIRMDYQELIFLAGFPNGAPVTFEGTFVLRPGAPGVDSTAGTFRVEHRVEPPDNNNGNGDDETTIERTMIFDVQYWVTNNQRITTWNIAPGNNMWTEEITVDGRTFTLDAGRSSFIVSVFESMTPGVIYYRGNISARLVYTDENYNVTVVEKVGAFYGFNSAWAATETHRTDVTVSNDEWTIVYQIRPSVSVNKILQWVPNEVSVISFEGNYREVHQSFAGLRYDIFEMPLSMWYVPDQGGISMETFNIFEQLPAPNLSFMRGHPAEDDIHRLFAMQILQGDPRFYVPEQAITRGQFLTALARAINLPVEEVVLPRTRGNQQPVAITLFTDVDSTRPEFRYIQAIQRAGIAFGRADGKFYFDYPISRQEAIVTTIRALGLTEMALNPTVVSPFMDSDDIAYWAMRDISVALYLGIISPDDNGYLHPRRAISKGEAAALFNHMLEFMRNGMVGHYAEQIVNIAR